MFLHDDHLCGKPGNLREFDSHPGNIVELTKNQQVSEKILSWKMFLANFTFGVTAVCGRLLWAALYCLF